MKGLPQRGNERMCTVDPSHPQRMFQDPQWTLPETIDDTKSYIYPHFFLYINIYIYIHVYNKVQLINEAQ